ncbi:MAG TPA: FtsX-like permease family protein [Bryobacteraceae bacterium]|nr:FtsX-like permease family protein [Bryobacteraceae bacterium]
MILKLVWENVRFRPVRTLLSILLIAVPVTLILTLIGLSRGFLEDSKKRAEGVGADIIVQPPGSSLMSFNGAPMSDKLVALLGKQPHVAEATGTVIQPIGGFDSMTGIDLAAFDRMSGGFIFEQGHPFQSPNDVIIDSYYARQRGVKAGSTLNVWNRNWHVAGIVEPGKLSHIFVQIGVLQDLTNQPGKVSQVYLKLDDAGNANFVVGQLKKILPDYRIYTRQQWESLISVNNIPMLSTFINVIIGIGLVIGFAVVSLSMYMAVLQRTREIGILKSLGASKGFIMGLILWEALVLGLGGTFFGILLSFASRIIMRVLVPASLPQAIVPTWWPVAGLIAVGAALLGALYPGWLAVRQDPIEALAYE